MQWQRRFFPQNKIMKYILPVFCFFSAANLAAQNYSDKVKLLGQYGIPYFYNRDIEANIEKWRKNDSNVTSDILGRSVLWFKEMELAQKTNRLPWFIKFIPAANTGYDNSYTGPEGSKGMWPLSFAIAKKYGLTMNSYIDERRNMETSADAACRYIADLQYIYKDWLKTITAFRIGAIRLNQVIRLANNSLDFNDIYKVLTPEEREPVVQFYAAVTVMYFRHDFKIHETVYKRMKMDTVSTPIPLKFQTIHDYTGITPQELYELNPQFISTTIPWFGKITYFNVPEDKKSIYNRVKDSMISNEYSRHNPVPEMDTTVEVKNEITYISVHPVDKNTGKKPEIIQDTATMVWVNYTVKTGDGFYTLSDVFDCSIEDMKIWNGITNNTLIANSVIRFYVKAEKLEFYKRIDGLNHLQKREIALGD